MTSSLADGELQKKIEEYKGRERIYMAGLIGQEGELNSLRRMASDVLGAYGDVSRAAVRGSLVDPTSNMEVLLLRQKALEKDRLIGQLNEELEANRFDQKAEAGQSLMRKCKALLSENRELGDELRDDRMAELSAACQVERRQNAGLRQKCSEAAEFCKELSSENEKLQGTIAKVAGRLRESRAELEILRKERAEAKAKRKKEREIRKQVGGQSVTAAPADSASGIDAPSAGAISSAATVQQPPLAPVLAQPSVFESIGEPDSPLAEVAVVSGNSAPPNAEKEKKRRKDDDGHRKDKKEKKRKKGDAPTQVDD